VSYPTAAIGEIARFVGGGTPSKANAEFYTGDIPWVSPKDMKVWRIDRSEDLITQAAVDGSAAKMLPAETVLLVVRSGILKHTLPVAIAARPLTINQDLKGLIPTDHVDANYLARIIKAAEPTVLGWVRATTADNFPVKKLKEMSIPLPPLPEQQRIAAILDQADALRRLRRQSLSRLSDLGQAIFYEMFGDVRANEQNWPDDMVLSDMSEIISGITKGRQTKGQQTRAVSYMTVATVQDGFLNLENVKTIEATDKEIERYRLQKDDILLTEGGDPDKLGRGALWRGELDECIHQNHVFRVRIKSERLEPIFASWLIASQRGKSYFLRSAKQTTGIASINSTQLKAFPMLLPPSSLQKKFAARLDELTARQSLATDALRATEDLFASLQQRAFRGEL